MWLETDVKGAVSLVMVSGLGAHLVNHEVLFPNLTVGSENQMVFSVESACSVGPVQDAKVRERLIDR